MQDYPRRSNSPITNQRNSSYQDLYRQDLTPIGQVSDNIDDKISNIRQQIFSIELEDTKTLQQELEYLTNSIKTVQDQMKTLNSQTTQQDNSSEIQTLQNQNFKLKQELQMVLTQKNQIDVLSKRFQTDLENLEAQYNQNFQNYHHITFSDSEKQKYKIQQESEIERLQSHLSLKQQKLNNIFVQINETQNSNPEQILMSYKVKLQELQNSKIKLQNNLKLGKQNQKIVYEKLIQAQNTLSNNNQVLEQKENMLYQLISEIQDMQHQIQMSEQESTLYQQDINHTNENIANQYYEMQKTVAQLTQSNARIEQQNYQLSDKMELLHSQIEELEKHKNELIQELDSFIEADQQNLAQHIERTPKYKMNIEKHKQSSFIMSNYQQFQNLENFKNLDEQSQRSPSISQNQNYQPDYRQNQIYEPLNSQIQFQQQQQQNQRPSQSQIFNFPQDYQQNKYDPNFEKQQLSPIHASDKFQNRSSFKNANQDNQILNNERVQNKNDIQPINLNKTLFEAQNNQQPQNLPANRNSRF